MRFSRPILGFAIGAIAGIALIAAGIVPLAGTAQMAGGAFVFGLAGALFATAGRRA